MTRQLLSSALVFGLLASLPLHGARADELPTRKAGLWEMKVARAGSTTDLAMQQCTDESTDKEMSTSFSPMVKEICSKKDVQKTANGYFSDSVCGLAGVSIVSHAEIKGDFNSAYTITSTSHSEGGPAAMKGDHVTTVEAKWLGACKPDQRPGDMVMPGGLKMNIHDMDKLQDKLKGLFSKPKE